MSRFVGRIARVAIVALSVNLFIAAPAQGTPIVVATVMPVASLFHYNYSITFDPLDDEIAFLNVVVLPGDATLDASLVAPAGYLADYDPGLGILSFLPVIGFPPVGPVTDFEFNSAHRPGPTIFDGLTINGAPVGGPTTGPVGVAVPVPEPATWVLLGIGLGALGRRRFLTVRGRSHG